MRHWLLGTVVVLGGALTVSAQPNEDLTLAEQTIRDGVVAYVKAYNAHEADKVAEMWSPEAVYLDRTTGESLTGRAAIAEHFKELFKEQPELKLDVDIESIQFLSPNVAVEHGTAKFLSANAEPEKSDYTAVYVRHAGKWLLDRVTDDENEEQVSHYEQLKVLEWLVGDWVDQDDTVRIDTECHWAKNQNFLVRSFSVATDERIELSGMQIIGWDAADKRIRSWTFDSDGGFSEGAWTRKEDAWFIQNKGVLADGRVATMLNVMRPVDENSFTWKTVERTAGGELLPNIDEVVVVRE